VNRFSIIVFLLLAAGTSHAAERTLDRTFTVSPDGSLTVEADSASVQVSGADTGQVIVHMVARGSVNDLAGITLDAAQSGNDVNVVLRQRGKGSWFSWFSWNGEQHIEVTVPRHYAVHVRTSGGSIHLKDIVGTANLKTSGGEIVAKDIIGDAELRTSGGSIHTDAIRGNVAADTSGGDIRLMRVDGRIDADTSGGSVHCSLVGANRGVSATTSGGDIELILPRNSSGNVDAATSGGGVSSELPIHASVRKDSRLEGTLNGGGPRIHARTSGGSISLRAEN
jgi:hypothetical protein